MTVRKIPTDIRGLSFIEQSSFAAGDPGSGYVLLRAKDIKFDPTQSMHAYATEKGFTARGPDVSIAGGKGGTLSFSIPLRGGNGAMSTFARLAQNMCTVKHRNGGANLVTTGSSTSTVVVLEAGLDTNYAVGDMIAVESGTSLQIRMISAIVDNGANRTFTVEPNFATTPSSGDELEDIDTIVPRTGEDATKYLTFRFCQDGDGANVHKFTLTGCCGSFKITTTADSLPMVEFTFNVDSWVSAESSLDAVTADTFSSPRPMLGSPCYVDDTATDTESFSFDPGIAVAPLTSTNGTNGRVGWIVTGNAPKPTIKPYWDTAWLTKMSASTKFQLTVESIKDANEGWAFIAPACQVLSTKIGDIQGVQASEIDIQCVDPGTGLTLSTATYIPLWAIGVTGAYVAA